MSTFEAKFDGWCPQCKERIEAGQEVLYTAADELVHVDCDTQIEERPTVTCTDCWLIKPCECD